MPRPAPAAPTMAPAPAPIAVAAVGPRGEPQMVGIPDLLEKEFLGREPRRGAALRQIVK